MKEIIYAEGLKAPAAMPEGLQYDSAPFQSAYSMMYEQAKQFKPAKGVKESHMELQGYRGETIGCFVLEPEGAEGILPAVIYYHGGGFCAQVAEVNLKLAEYYVRHTGCKVFIPEYRTTFQEKYPCQTEDCYEAAKYVYQNCEKLGVSDRIILYGDSAGACLAAAVSLMARDRGEFPIAAQMLLYPCTDYKMSGESFSVCQSGSISAEFVKFMWDFYLDGHMPDETGYASPLYAKDLSGLPKAYVEPQEHDCLRDDGVAYAKRLEEAGIPVECNLVKGSYHGVEEQFDVPFVQELLAKRAAVLKDFFESKA